MDEWRSCIVEEVCEKALNVHVRVRHLVDFQVLVAGEIKKCEYAGFPFEILQTVERSACNMIERVTSGKIA